MKRVCFIFVIVLCLALNLQAATWFVTADGTGDGSSWVQASSLADALAGASAADELWLAEGVYAGASIFAVTKNDLKLYGGFTTSMNSFGERDYEAYPTVLDGEGARQIMSVNSGGVRIDGLIFKNASTAGNGGCIGKTGSGAVIVANSSFSSNVMTGSKGIGSGIYAGGGTLTVTNCSFTYSSGSTYARGAGIYAINTQVVLRDSFFRGNKAGTQEKNGGGAVYIRSGQLDMSGCVFQTNATASLGSEAYGGAVSLSLNLNSRIRNCVFDGNKAGCGGAIVVWTSQNYTTIVENCTFAATNRADFNGGSLFVESGTVLAKNNVFSESSAGWGGRDICTTMGTVSASYCCFDSVFDSLVGNISQSNCFVADPLFAGAGDFHLRSSQGRWDPGTKTWITDASEYSPCIDRGDPAADYSLEPMNNGARINLGAYGNTPEASKSYTSAVPSVRNDPAAVTYNSVKMNGTLTAGGIARVIVYYGLSDGGTDPGGWDFSEEVIPSPRTDESFFVGKVGLVPQKQYYYRAYAFNSEGANWAGSSAGFTTGSEPPGGGPGIIHVDKDATGLDTGTDWPNAYPSLAEGILAANEQANQIWVAAGHYDEGCVLFVNKAIDIYGGFAGSETDTSQRLPGNETLLDGAGARTIIWTISPDTVRFDSLTFSNAYSARTPTGAGLFKTGTGRVEARNTKFKNNVSFGTLAHGIAAYFSGGSVLLSNCVFTDNSGDVRAAGAGFYATSSDVTVEKCKFYNCQSGGWDSWGGGAIYLSGGKLLATDCLFERNSNAFPGGHTSGGGAARITGNISPVFKNCVFTGNKARLGGALHIAIGSTNIATIENCSIGVTNTAFRGGALYLAGGTALIKNSILWGNTATDSSLEIHATGTISRVEGSYSCLSGTDETYIFAESDATIDLRDGIIVDDPLFASDSDLHLMSKIGRWDPELQDWMQDAIQSPCIDAGDPADPFDDEPMPNGKRINMGGYGGTDQASMSYVPKGSIILIY